MKFKKENQLKKIKQGNPTLSLVKPCRVNDGIFQLQDNEFTQLVNQFEKAEINKKITFFIPASGSGSRMFGNLFEYINNTDLTSFETIEFIEQFLNNISKFPFYNKLPKTFKENIKLGKIDIKSLIKFILLEEGLNFGQLPKGLVPFHLYDKFIINPFQEQILQGTQIAGEKSEFHFTINPKFKTLIDHSIKILKEITGIDFSYSFSIQKESTHAVAFDSNHNVILDSDNNNVLRPSGHGALIENLNTIDADIIFIKNIDNIQHFNKASEAIETRKVLGGLLLNLQNDIFKILNKIDLKQDWQEFTHIVNEKYELNIDNSILNNIDKLYNYLNRPIRVCGMVKNEGQAGGGPFWVKKDDGSIEKQIIEKSQIDANQLSILLHATHFNPVDIACGIKNYKKTKFNLNNFVNDDLYFIVNKTEKGKPITYVEQPGLWNGGMYNWLTVFIEIKSNCFSPVKTVLDLLKPLHQQ